MKRCSRWVLLLLVTAGGGLWPVAGTLAANEKDACALLQQADVEAAFTPRKFDSGKPGHAVKSSKTMASVSSCTYTSRGDKVKDMVTVTLLVRRAPSDETGTTPEAARAGAVKLDGAPVDVAGLGKGAYMVNLGSSIQLNVFRGKREWLIFGGRAKMLDNNAVLANLTRVAKATVDR